MSGKLKKITATTEINKTQDVAAYFKRICTEVLDIHYLKLPRNILTDPSKITADDLMRLLLFYGIPMNITITFLKEEQNHFRIGKGVKKKRDAVRKRPLIRVEIEDI